MSHIFSECPTCGSPDIEITTGALKSRLLCKGCPQDLTYYSQIDKVRDRDERRALIRMLMAETVLADKTIHDLIVLYNKMNICKRDTDFLEKLLTMPEQKKLNIKKRELSQEQECRQKDE